MDAVSTLIPIDATLHPQTVINSTPASLHSQKPPSLPETQIFLPSIVVFFAVYHIIAPFYPTAKQRSWILSAVCSAFMTLTSLPFIYDYIIDGFDVQRAGTRSARGSSLAYVANRVFQAYLLVDQLVAFRYYQEHFALLTGWMHHNAYILIVEIAIRRSWADVFSLCTIMELPTFLLAFSSLHPSVRPRMKYIFAFVFFATRIVFHLMFAFAFIYGSGRAILGRVPGLIILSVWPLHAYWFWGNLRGLLGIKKKKVADESSTAVTPGKGSHLLRKRQSAGGADVVATAPAESKHDTVDAVVLTEDTPSSATLPHNRLMTSPPSPTQMQHTNVALSIQVRRGGQNASLEKSLRLDFEGDVPVSATTAV